jgi:hypothetical protein
LGLSVGQCIHQWGDCEHIVEMMGSLLLPLRK